MAEHERSPFAFLPTPAGRTAEKPRTNGLTMMMDWGIPIGAQEDLLELVAPYVDFAKIVVGTARLYRETYLLEKLDTYRRHLVSPFLGGQFLEFVYEQDGFAGVGRFCEEALRLGIEAVEVSDNVVRLTEEERRRLIRMVAETGLEVHGEVGSKSDESSGASIIEQARACFESGAGLVLIEGAELLSEGSPRSDLIDEIRAGIDSKRVMYELAGPWIPGTHATDVYALKVFLVDTFGPDVNLANIMPDDVWETEALRRGLSVPGPPKR